MCFNFLVVEDTKTVSRYGIMHHDICSTVSLCRCCMITQSSLGDKLMYSHSLEIVMINFYSLLIVTHTHTPI